MATACMASVNCVYFGSQNLNDADSWIITAYPGFGSATLFDANFQPKPAYFDLRYLLEQAEPRRRPVNHR